MKNYESKTIKITDHLEVPKIGMGTWQITGQSCVQSVIDALDIGYRSIDTAQIYENEMEVGAGIKDSGIKREEIFLTSKVWRENLSEKDVLATTEESLNRLQTDYIDLMLIHWPNEKYEVKGSLKALSELKKVGKIKAFGVSNFPVKLLKQSREFESDFACNQVEYHPYLNQNKVLTWLRDHNKFLIAYSPLARGEIFNDTKIQEIAQKRKISCAQVVLSWLLRKDQVVAIPKSSSKEHLQSNWESQKIVLEDNDLRALDSLSKLNGRLINPEWSPQWDS